MRFFVIFIALLFIAAEPQLLSAATVHDRIKDLSSPNPGIRQVACQNLAHASGADQDLAVDALLGALNDTSDYVKVAAMTALGNIGPGAKKATPKILACYEHDICSKTVIIKTLGRIAPESPDAIDFLIDVVRGGKGGPARSMEELKAPAAHRREAMQALASLGPKAGKAIPVLMNVLTISGHNVSGHLETYLAAADALSFIGVGDKQVLATLKRFQQGKEFHVKDSKSSALKRAIVASDSAVKRLEQAEAPVAGNDKEKKE